MSFHWRIFSLFLALSTLLCLFPAEQSGLTLQAAPYRTSLKIATFNMYVGFDMSPVVNGHYDTTDPNQIATLIETLYGTYKNNHPKERIRAFAKEVVKSSPDIVNLQEASDLSIYGFSIGDSATTLAEEIRNAGGPEYETLHINTMSFKGMFETSSMPVSVGFQDREAVLFRKELRCKSLDDGIVYQASRQSSKILDQQVTLNRGAIGLTCESPSGLPFYLYNTHLDVASQAQTQEAQARELIAYINRTAVDLTRPVIVSGDFNAREDLKPTNSYAILREAGFTDSFRAKYPDADLNFGLTCCQKENLRNQDSVAGSRYDYVFFTGPLAVRNAGTFADKPFTLPNSSEAIWPSDHIGVWAEFEWENPVPF